MDRSSLVPEKFYRFRMFWQHRQMLPDDWQLSAELGYISDRNFLQSYYEREWDTLKDETTDMELKQTRENRSLEHFGRRAFEQLFHRRPSGCRGPIIFGWVSRC